MADGPDERSSTRRRRSLRPLLPQDPGSTAFLRQRPACSWSPRSSSWCSPSSIAVLRSLPGPVFFPLRALAVVYTDLFRGIPTILVIYIARVRAAGAPAARLARPAVLLGDRRARPRLLGVRRGGLSGRDRVGAPSPGGGRPVARAHAVAVAPPRRAAAGRPPGDPAVAERLHRPPEGHGAGRDPRGHRGVPASADRVRATFNYTPFLATAFLFVADHDPARAVHRLVARAGPATAASAGHVRDRGDPRSRASGSPSETLEVLRGIDLVVEDHEVVCLIGASGSGKSTLLRCIDLLEPVDAGRIWIEGDEVTAAGVDQNAVRRRIGIVFQAFNLFPHMTVMRNVTLAQEKALGRSAAEARTKATELLARFGLVGQGGRLSRPTLRRPAAARRDRAGPRDGSGRDAAGRGDERPRPGPRRRSARCDPGAGRAPA